MFTKKEVLQRIAYERSNGELCDSGFNLACFIACSALIAQKDKAGVDYAHHIMRVARHNTDSEAKMIIGVLHDVVEDSDWTLDDLTNVGFADRIVAGVDGVTHREGERYFDSIERCGLNSDSVDVKIKDNCDNMSQGRNNYLPRTKDLERLQKYTVARNYLIDIKRGAISPGAKIREWMENQNSELQDWELLAKYSSEDAVSKHL